jgi:hypothetical protein
MTESNSIESQLRCASQRRQSPVLSKIDMGAMVVAVVFVGLIAITVLVMVVIEMAKLGSVLCANPNAWWPLAIFGAAVGWVIVRWKKMCIF